MEPVQWTVDGMELTLRPMKLRDMEQLVPMLLSEHWTPTLSEARMMYLADPEGYFGVFLADGTLISHAILINVSDKYAYFATFITSASFRGRGVGRRFIKELMKIARPRTVELDALVGTPKFYGEIGFEMTQIKMNYLSCVPNKEYLSKIENNNENILIKRITSVDLNSIYSFDRSLCCFDRSRFLEQWLLDSNSTSLVATDPASNVVYGYINIRPDFVRSPGAGEYKIKGFYADNEAIAVQLLSHVFLHYLTHCLCISCRYPNCNEESVMKVFNSFTEKKIDKTSPWSRMRFGNNVPNFKWENVYTLASLYNTYL